MYKRRVKVFLGLIGAVLLLLIARIAHLQILRGEHYRGEFERSMRDVQLLPAARGQITDRNGSILAADLPCRDFCLDWRFLTDDPRWSRRQRQLIQRATGCSPQEANEAYEARAGYTLALAERLSQEANSDFRQSRNRIIERVEGIRRAVQRRAGPDVVRIREEQEFHPVVKALSEQAAVLADADIREGRTVGAVLRPGHKRYYPYGELACHAIGLTGAVTEADLVQQNLFPPDTDWLTARRREYEPDDSIGISGVEKMCEPLLRGRRGYRVLDTGGRRPVELEGESAEPGADVHMTLDVHLQEALARRLRETGHNGSVVVLSVAHNDVLAMVSVPTYDLNRYRQEYPRLMEDEFETPLLNRAVAGRYPPGSSVKPIVALAALATGRITPAARPFECRGHLYERTPWLWRCPGSHGALDVHEAIMKSCNVYFYHLGERVGLPVLDEWFRMFGLDERPGTGLPEEKAGHVPSPAWIADPKHRGSLVGESMQEGIGQGLLLATPTHMANVMATIARGGRFMDPMLVLEGRPERTVRDLPLPAGGLAAVRQGMKAVVAAEGGTAYKAFHFPGAQPLGVEVCGKTGTAQVSPQRLERDHPGRGNAGDIVRDGKMAWFAGFAPAGRPRIAFAIVLEYVTEGTGGSNAGPVARDLVRICRDMGYLSD